VENYRLDSVWVSYLLNDLGANKLEFFKRKAIRKMFKIQQSGVFNPLIITPPEAPRLPAVRDYLVQCISS